MTRHMVAGAAALAAVAILTGGSAAPAGADGGFGDHVRHCAQTLGLDGERNPGMHEGASNWTPDHTCPD